MSAAALRSRGAGRRAALPTSGILFPLDSTYAHAGLALPTAKRISPDDIPMPYRPLLVHEQDMTPTLERHVGGEVVLRPLSVLVNEGWYLRRVLLAQQSSGRPVEMGAVRLKLGVFPARIRAQIVRNEIPLGRLLRAGDVDYRSQPCAFLAVTPNAEMMGVFWMRGPLTLYGRRTEVMLGGVKVGDIVEVLPPL
jgi:chorismate-pyruvate lyase